MKKLLFLLLFLGVCIYLGPFAYNFAKPQFQHILYYSPCDTPIHYHLGTIDSRFNLSTDKLTSDIKEASQIWDKIENKKLFVYDPKGQLTINLVYDERQKLNTQINSLEQQLNTNKNTLNPQVTAYEQQAADFKKKLELLNAQIEYWNRRGGAPPDVYQQLVAQQQQLNAEAQSLNEMAKSLNRSADQYNAQVDQLSQAINNYNQTLSLKPEEGLYDPNSDTIDIYFVVTHAELIHTLAHEMGHALGMEHTTNAEGIMYPYTSQSITPSQDDINELNQICAEKNIAQIFMDRLSLGLQNLNAQIQNSIKLSN